MNLEPQWIAGFTDGEGCFHISINKNDTLSVGFQVLPEFTITQHVRSIQVLHGLKDFFGTGVVRTSRGKDSQIMAYRVRNTKDLVDTIIPFFEKYELKTSKKIDFLKFRRVLLMIQRGDHLTEEGLKKIREIRLDITSHF